MPRQFKSLKEAFNDWVNFVYVKPIGQLQRQELLGAFISGAAIAYSNQINLLPEIDEFVNSEEKSL